MIEKTGNEIRAEIEKITAENKHVLDCYPATVQINAPRAMMQESATARLDTLYKLSGEPRPVFKCDDFTKLNY